MTTGPADENAAAVARSRLRASHADREHVIGTLKAAFVQGRLTKDELDVRVGQTFAARTYAELARLTALKTPLVRLRGQWVELDPKRLWAMRRPIFAGLRSGSVLTIWCN